MIKKKSAISKLSKEEINDQFISIMKNHLYINRNGNLTMIDNTLTNKEREILYEVLKWKKILF